MYNAHKTVLCLDHSLRWGKKEFTVDCIGVSCINWNEIDSLLCTASK